MSNQAHHIAIFGDLHGVLRVIGKCVQLGFHCGHELSLANAIKAGAFETKVIVDERGHGSEIAAVKGRAVEFEYLLGFHNSATHLSSLELPS